MKPLRRFCPPFLRRLERDPRGSVPSRGSLTGSQVLRSLQQATIPTIYDVASHLPCLVIRLRQSRPLLLRLLRTRIRCSLDGYWHGSAAAVGHRPRMRRLQWAVLGVATAVLSGFSGLWEA